MPGPLAFVILRSVDLSLQDSLLYNRENMYDMSQDHTVKNEGPSKGVSLRQSQGFLKD